MAMKQVDDSLAYTVVVKQRSEGGPYFVNADFTCATQEQADKTRAQLEGLACGDLPAQAAKKQ